MVRESRRTIHPNGEIERVGTVRGTPVRPVNPLAHTHASGELADLDTGSARSAIPLQRLAGNGAVAQLLAAQQSDDANPTVREHSPVLDLVGRGGGSPLESDIRRSMEASFGQDFSAVRVHSGPAAAASAASVQAIAYTVGNDIVMPSGVDRTSEASLHTLAHELTHVTQQRCGPVEGTPAPGGIMLSDPSDRFEREAEQTAAEVMMDFTAQGAP